MSRVLKMAVIGTGMAWERLHLPAVRELQDKYEVVALANPSREKLIDAANKIQLAHNHIYQDYHKMLKKEQIDVVNIAVPIDMNYVISEQVAKAGFHIICEKPLAPTIEEAKKFLDISQKYNVHIMIAENYRYNEENNIIKNLIEEERIGRVQYFIKHNCFDFTEEMKKNSFAAKEWRQHPNFPGGALLDGGVHDIAALRYIFGNVSELCTFGKSQEEEYCPYEYIHTNFSFSSGIVGTYIYNTQGKEIQRPLMGLRIVGTKGMIYLEEKTCGIINVFYNDGGHEMIPFRPKRGYYNEFLNYYESVVNGDNLKVPPIIEFGDTMLVFAMLQSAKNKQVVTIDSQNRFLMHNNRKYQFNHS